MSSDKSFFEYLLISDRERINSAFLAWVFSKNCKALNAKEKSKLLYLIFGEINSIENLEVYTELNGIDIVIINESNVLIIENKFKSSLHSNQLEKYESFCENNPNFQNKNKYYFYLTLLGEKPSKSNWKDLSYNHVFACFKKNKLNEKENHTIILKEYLLYINKLLSVIKL